MSQKGALAGAALTRRRRSPRPDRLPGASLRGLLYAGLLAGLSSPLAAIEVIDDAAKRVVLQAPATRVITLAPHLTEMVYAIGAGDRLVATVAYSDFPQAARKLPRVGAAGQVSGESLLALQPDLVLAWLSGTPARTVARLRDFGIPVYLSEPRQLRAIADNIEKIGQLLGRASAATALASEQRAAVDALRARYATASPVRVFYQVWTRPLLTVNGAHVLGEALALCGAIQLFADAPLLTPQVSLEAVAAARPALILFAAPTGERERWTGFWDNVPGLSGVRIRGLDPDLLSRPGPRMLAGVTAMCAAIDASRRGELQ